MHRVYLGHHFYGAGNLGDDLILAGFLQCLSSKSHSLALTCSTPHDRHSQQLRFPSIRWIPYDTEARRRAISESDVWLGVGGSPFQSDDSEWFTNHLLEEAALCEELRVPMYYLAVGVNNAEVLERPEIRHLLNQAEHIWARDKRSYQLLKASATKPDCIRLGADLAHALLANSTNNIHCMSPQQTTQSLSYCFNFHQELEPILPEVKRCLSEFSTGSQHWLVQEIRELPKAERRLYSLLPPECQTMVSCHLPDYQASTALSLLENWPQTTFGIASRYHAVIVQAWRGTKLGVLNINDKLSAIAEELDLPTFQTLVDFSPKRDLCNFRLAKRSALESLACRAYGAVLEWLEHAKIGFARKSSSTASLNSLAHALNKHIGIICPDSLGDLVLRQPLISTLLDAGYQVTVIAQAHSLHLLPYLDSRAKGICIEQNPYIRPAQGEEERLLNIVSAATDATIGILVFPTFNTTIIEEILFEELPNIPVLRFAKRLDPVIRYRSLFPDRSTRSRIVLPIEIDVEPHWHEHKKVNEILRLGFGLEPKKSPELRSTLEQLCLTKEVQQRLGLSSGKYAVSCPIGAANVSIKGIPAPLVKSSLSILSEKNPLPLLLVGSSLEKEALLALQADLESVQGTPTIISWTGEPEDLPVLLGLIADAALYVGPDTGPMHMAAAFGKPVVAVMGGGTAPRFTPIAKQSLIVTEELPCFGCGWACIFKKPLCLHNISVEKFELQFRKFLEQIQVPE